MSSVAGISLRLNVWLDMYGSSLASCGVTPLAIFFDSPLLVTTTSKAPPLVPTRLALNDKDFGVNVSVFFGFSVNTMAALSSPAAACSVGWNC